MSRGGVRPNSGPKKGSRHKHTLDQLLAKKRYEEVLFAEIDKNAIPLAEALVNKGKSGDVQALKEIHDRRLGRVKEEIDLTSKGGKLVIYVPKKRTTLLESE